MKTSDIPDRVALEDFITDRLEVMTGAPPKVILSKLHKLHRRGLIEYGVSIRTGFLTDEGKQVLESAG